MTGFEPVMPAVAHGKNLAKCARRGLRWLGGEGAAKSAHIQSTGSEGPETPAVQDGESGAAGMSAEARRMHARVHADAEETKFRVAESCPRPADEWN